MARINGIAEDLLKITATLPWWVGIALAAAVYVLLQPFMTGQMFPVRLENLRCKS